MLVQVNPINEQEVIARIERKLMLTFGLSYSELQNMPSRVLKIWTKQKAEEKQKEDFNRMVMKNSNS